MSTTRPDGRTDTVCATARYHERRHGQLVPLVHPRPTEPNDSRSASTSATATAGSHGWIPLDMQLEAWTDRAGAEALLAATEHRRAQRDRTAGLRHRGAGSPNTQRAHLAGQPTTYASDSATASTPSRPSTRPRIRRLVTDFLAAIDEARPPRVDLDAATAAVARGSRRNGGDPDWPHVATDPIRALIRREKGIR